MGERGGGPTLSWRRVFMSQCDPSSEGLAGFLEAHHADIVRRWHERVRATLPPRALSPGDVIDTLPEFLGAVVAALRGKSPWRSTPLSPGDTIAEAHGAQRFRMGLDITAVVREYSLLRDVILEVI